MNIDREKFWRNELLTRLSREVSSDSASQVRWLAGHIEIYLLRWVGFIELKRVNINASLQNDVFAVLTAAINILNEIAQQPSLAYDFPNPEWDFFCEALEGVYDHPESAQFSIITRSYSEFKDKLNKNEQ